jgi:arylsulfatase A-like enzyme
LWLALADTDEWAHRGDYDGYLDALRSADRVIGELWAELAQMGQYGAETTLIVTADHGRAEDFVSHGAAPESARVWLVAAGGAVPARGSVPAARTIHLRDIAPTVRAWLGVPADPSPRAGAPIAELFGAPAPVVAEVR